MLIKEKWRPITIEDLPNLQKAVDEINSLEINNLSIKITTEDGRNDIEILDSTEELYYGGCLFEKTLDKLDEAIKKDTDKGAYFDCVCPGRWIADFENGRCLYTLDDAINTITYAMNEAMFNYMMSNGIKYNWSEELRLEFDEIDKCESFKKFMQKLIKASENTYLIRDREAGNVIETNLSLKEAIEMLEKFEKEDMAEGVYEKDFYEIVKED